MDLLFLFPGAVHDAHNGTVYAPRLSWQRSLIPNPVRLPADRSPRRPRHLCRHRNNIHGTHSCCAAALPASFLVPEFVNSLHHARSCGTARWRFHFFCASPLHPPRCNCCCSLWLYCLSQWYAFHLWYAVAVLTLLHAYLPSSRPV